jgi:hypothetical protein
MSIRNLLQFRLRTLLIVVTLVAIVIGAVVAYVRPLVGGISLRGWDVVVHLSPEGSERMISSVPGFSSPGSPADPYNFYIHDSYISVSLFSLATMLAIIATMSVVAFLIVKRVVARRKTVK